MPQPRQLIVSAAALVAGGALIATIWVSALNDASQDITAFPERRLPLAVLLAILAVAAVAPLGVLTWSQDVVVALGLALAATATLIPMWAAWPDLDARWRALALATGPLAVAGLAMMVRSWIGCALAVAAGLLHAVTYDPFRDPGCARVCLRVTPWLSMSVNNLALFIALSMAVAASFVCARALRRGGLATLAGAGALGIAAMAVVRWRTVGDSDAYADLLLTAVTIPGLVALPAVAAWATVAHRRSAARRLAHHLAEDPDRLLALGQSVDTSLLSPGQQLALRNAQLAAEASARLAEVQTSQRRVVAAADAERQRIERDLHDGTQQRLVGVLLQLSGLGLDAVEQKVRSVLSDLRSFTQGAFPTVLEEEGLEAALAELAATSDAQLRLEIQLAAPVPSEHARAVYALVALAKVGTVDVSVSSCGDRLDVAVVGMTSVDLGHVQDRFGALAGTLTVTDDKIEGTLPCAL